MKSAVVFIADGSEEIEALSPVDYLRRAGVEVCVVAVGTASRTVMMSHNISVNADYTLDSYLSASFPLPDAVVIPGGLPGSVNIAQSDSVISFIDAANDAGKLICSICAAPARVLPRTRVLNGKKWTCYPGEQTNASVYESKYIEGKAFVHDGNLITGRGPGAAEEFSMEIVKTLCGEDIYSKIKSGSMQR